LACKSTHRCPHVVVDAARRDAAEHAEGVVVGIEQHLLGLRKICPEKEGAALTELADKNLIWFLFGSIESIGILVSRGDLTLQLVDEFFSIPILEGWRKLAPYVDDLRKEFDSPQTWEWYQWLHDRLRERHQASPRVAAHARSPD
jgi:hypothetical protein